MALHSAALSLLPSPSGNPQGESETALTAHWDLLGKLNLMRVYPIANKLHTEMSSFGHVRVPFGLRRVCERQLIPREVVV